MKKVMRWIYGIICAVVVVGSAALAVHEVVELGCALALGLGVGAVVLLFMAPAALLVWSFVSETYLSDEEYVEGFGYGVR